MGMQGTWRGWRGRGEAASQRFGESESQRGGRQMGRGGCGMPSGKYLNTKGTKYTKAREWREAGGESREVDGTRRARRGTGQRVSEEARREPGGRWDAEEEQADSALRSE